MKYFTQNTDSLKFITIFTHFGCNLYWCIAVSIFNIEIDIILNGFSYNWHMYWGWFYNHASQSCFFRCRWTTVEYNRRRSVETILFINILFFFHHKKKYFVTYRRCVIFPVGGKVIISTKNWQFQNWKKEVTNWFFVDRASDPLFMKRK